MSKEGMLQKSAVPLLWWDVYNEQTTLQ